MEVPTSVAIFYLYTINLLMSTTYGVSRTSYSKCAGFCFEAPAGPRDHAARRMSAKLSLSLAFSLMALCQSFSLEPPYSVPVDPSSPPSTTLSYRLSQPARGGYLSFPSR